MKSFYLIICLITTPLFFGVVNGQQPFVNYTQYNGLPDDNVLDVAVDHNNHLWFATQGGVAFYDRASWVIYTTADGLPDNFVNCVAIAPNGDVWAGTDAGLSRFDGANWTTYTVADGLLSNLVNHIAIGGDESVWIAVTGGVSSWNDTVFTNYTVAHGLPSSMVSYVGIDSDNNKWFCTWLGGVAKYDGQTFTVINKDSGLIDNNITSVAFDSAGNIFLGTYFGVTVLNPDDTWQRNIEHADGLYHEAVMDIAFDAQGRMWAGIFVDYLLDGGITGVLGAQYYSYGMDEGLVSLMVNRLAVDHSDNIWIATGGGVSMFYGEMLSVPKRYAQPEVTLFPNPAASSLNISAPDAGSAALTVTDLTGRVIWIGRMEQGSASLDLTGFPQGLYLLRIETVEHRMSRIIIKR
jgi:ligand-binding sensor domain-containing protein